jgi:uncharacterized cupredoxin-like copper-binding protein
MTAALAVALGLALVAVLAACDSGGPETTPLPIPGTSAHPRDVNIIAREYSFAPPTVDLVPGETVDLHVINAGLEVHETIIGNGAAQDAWEVSEAAVAGAPPGPTPVVSVPPGVSALRVVVASGQRVDMIWTVPASVVGFVVGCHIPGHWAKGMQVPVRAVAP